MRSFIILILLFASIFVSGQSSWRQIKQNGSGKVTFYWFPNNVNIAESKDVIDGIEHDLAFAFIDFINKKYDIDIEVEWIETKSFETVMQTVQSSTGGVFGASSISITEARMESLNFTPPYLADIAVLVSSPQVPIAHSPTDFTDIFNGKSAITIANTTLYDALGELGNSLDIDFDLNYVSNSGLIIEEIEKQSNAFGYIDLPNFLVSVQNGSKIRRQFFYPIKLRGLAMIYPKRSDWQEPVEDYFNSEQFVIDKNEIIGKYFGDDISSIIERISRSAEIGPFEEIMISNREKELQYEELLEAAKREKEKGIINIVLIIAIAFGGFGMVFLLVNNRNKAKRNRVLREQQEVIAQRNDQLKELNSEKNDLIKVLAHDLRSPLSNIVASSELLSDRKNLPDDDAKMLEIISVSSDKIQSMISKILDVDAIDSGKRNMNMEIVQVEELVDKVIKSNQKRADNKEISLTKEVSGDLQAAADKFYLTQVIENLVSNAIKFSSRGSSILVGVLEHKRKTRVFVKDEGPGFSEEDQKKIFKKFHKLTAKPTGGEETIGLGLSIVKSYTKLMGGKISFETKLGEGTTFFIDLGKSL